MAQAAITPKGGTTCSHHHGYQFTLCCNDCQTFACVKCVSSVHKGHNFDDLDFVVSIRKKTILKQIEFLEKTRLVELREDLRATETKLKDNEQLFQSAADKITKKRTKLKEELDMLSAKALSICEKNMDINKERITSHVNELECERAALVEYVQECKTAVQIGSNDEVYYAVKQEFYPSIPVRLFKYPEITVDANLTLLEEVFGKVEPPFAEKHLTPKYFKNYPSGKINKTSVEKSKESEAMAPQVVETTKETTQYKVLTESKVLADISVALDVYAIAPTSRDKVWLCTVDSKNLVLMDRTGVMKREVKFNVLVNGVATSPTTGHIWVSQTDNTIIEEVTTGKFTMSRKQIIRFKTSSKPLCLCVSRDDNVIVGMSGNITTFTPNGNVVHTTTYKKRKPVVYSPHTISECATSNNLAIVDFSLVKDGGSDKRSVIIVNRQLKEMFSIGSRSRGQDMGSCDVRYDTRGNLVIADKGHNECSFLLFSGTGTFITKMFIHRDISVIPVAMAVGRDNVLWAVFKQPAREHCNVELIQYYSN